MANDKASARRYRNFGAVLYPESAPEKWREIVGEWKVPVYVSPLHDRDVDPQNQPKKPHYHIVLAFDAPKNPDQARECFDQIGAVGCEIVQSLRGYARYLCHLDNPEKAQYKPDEVLTFGGADYAETIGLPTDKYKAIDEMIDYCEARDIVSYRELINVARREHRDWFRVLCDNGTVVVKEYLKSKDWERNKRKEIEWRAGIARVADEDGVLPDDPLAPVPPFDQKDLLEDVPK